VSDDKNIEQVAFKMAGEYFLPALTIVKDVNPCLDNELWQILRNIEFKNRYYYYQELLSRGYLSNPFLLQKLIDL
jgi:hypothetical protein